MSPQPIRYGSRDYVLVLILPRLKDINPDLCVNLPEEPWLAGLQSILAINEILMTALLGLEFNKDQIAQIIRAWWRLPNSLLRDNHPGILQQCPELIEFGVPFAILETQRWAQDPSRIPAAS